MLKILNIGAWQGLRERGTWSKAFRCARDEPGQISEAKSQKIWCQDILVEQQGGLMTIA